MVKLLNLQENVKDMRKEQAEKTDVALLDFLKKKPGALSLYQIAGEIGWSIGRVQKSVERLLRKGLVTYRRAFLGGRSLKLLVPSKSESAVVSRASVSMKSLVVELVIPVDLIDPMLWGEKACLYALDRLTLGVSAVSEGAWRKRCVWEVEVPLKREGNAVIAAVPAKIAGFYLLHVSDYVVSGFPSKSKVIVTVGNLRLAEKSKNVQVIS